MIYVLQHVSFVNVVSSFDVSGDLPLPDNDRSLLMMKSQGTAVEIEPNNYRMFITRNGSPGEMIPFFKLIIKGYKIA